MNDAKCEMCHQEIDGLLIEGTPGSGVNVAANDPGEDAVRSIHSRNIYGHEKASSLRLGAVSKHQALA